MYMYIYIYVYIYAYINLDGYDYFRVLRLDYIMNKK